MCARVEGEHVKRITMTNLDPGDGLIGGYFEGEMHYWKKLMVDRECGWIETTRSTTAFKAEA
jgi:hypothetical protein